MIVIYHNPECKITRKCLKILETQKLDQSNIRHKDLAVSSEKLNEILELLNYKPTDIIKKGHYLWISLLKYLKFTDKEWLDILIEYPSLMKSPIIISGNKAVIGRPPEHILDIL